MIAQSLTFMEKQVHIEQLQPIAKSQSITYIFEIINFLRKIQRHYSEYFFPYYEPLQQLFNAIERVQRSH